MTIVPAGVHDADLLALVLGADLRGERQVHLLGDGQCVHVRPQGHDRTGPPALQDSDDAGMGDPRLHLVAQLAELLGYKRGGTGLAIAKLRVLMDVPAPGDHLGHDLGGAAVGLLMKGIDVRSGQGEQEQGGDHGADVNIVHWPNPAGHRRLVQSPSPELEWLHHGTESGSRIW
jgi:hypothetical protein